jgi:hypothetical protein
LHSAIENGTGAPIFGARDCKSHVEWKHGLFPHDRARQGKERSCELNYWHFMAGPIR